ncbi:MAG TPA: hypothetical protein DHN29_16475 [Cytophagales bacterium]|nr:hypothetical protein [Cytophagales bacterium]|tara:strand:- start:3545 stop:3748 length:204 start_codon:yes stop_codon:yes gene_type:complete
MIDHAKNLETVLEARKTIATELAELESVLAKKKEIYLKYSGIVEYLASLQKVEESDTEPESIEPEAE